MNLEDITIDQDGIDWQNCLQYWAWILKRNPEFNILLVTKFGEIFVILDNGEVWFLSTSNASYEKVADTKEIFISQLEDEEFIDYYFLSKVLTMLQKTDLRLEKGECFGFHIPCVFKECSFDTDNFKKIEVEKYLIGLGDLLGKFQNTPSGEKVSFKAIE
ncbi:DUF1851 domain-containing protein [Shewanella acanthi]|uniref:DUF1851 domain-containing protein n=1 Tax=Shewanella acanthi TaxID=2864212 RepID=UPI001C6601D5|nr:DUF1851 domain-containing protein [Shewanella acanthi]QYJ77510.1 DUF1851 domain-containing protein [Shewanella acanthi]